MKARPVEDRAPLVRNQVQLDGQCLPALAMHCTVLHFQFQVQFHSQCMTPECPPALKALSRLDVLFLSTSFYPFCHLDLRLPCNGYGVTEGLVSLTAPLRARQLPPLVARYLPLFGWQYSAQI